MTPNQDYSRLKERVYWLIPQSREADLPICERNKRLNNPEREGHIKDLTNTKSFQPKPICSS